MRKRVLLTFLGLLAAGAVGAPAVFALFGSRPPIVQPVAFNHRLHVEDNGLACVDCHIYVTTQTFAGLPRVEKCLECHEEAQTESPEEEKIRQAAADGRELAWNRIYQIPDHVYSSHRRHVVAGKLACAECHGPIAETTSPPARPLNDISMDFCMDCHRQNGVTNDCIACHM
jgi:hypothetical protein